MRVKWILIIGAALVVAAIIAVLIVVSGYDYNKLKPAVARAVMGATGRELTMAGDVRLDIGFRPGLYVEDVSLQNASWGSRPRMAEVKRFEVQVALLPLIGGKIDVRKLILFTR